MNTDRGPLPVNCSCRPLRLDSALSVAVVITDLSERMHAEQVLRKTNEELEQRVKARTAEVEAANTRLRSYARYLIDHEEEIKRKLAADLHDELGQNLSLMSINFALLKDALPAEVRQKHRTRFSDVNELIEEAGRVVRRIMSDLRPPMLDEYGLTAALRWLCDLFSGRTGIKVDRKAVDASLKLPPEIQPTLFRIAQEAMLNIIKYAKASRVRVELRNVNGRIRLAITDNGRGFEPPSHPIGRAESGWGLTIMRERAQSIGGSFRLDSSPGKGSRVVVELPVRGHR